MAKKLLISDLDGTLLDNINELSLPHSDKLNTLLDQGIDFTIATGRDFENTKLALKNTRIYNPMILTNGAILAEFPSGKMIEYLTLHAKTVEKIFEYANLYRLKPMVFASYDCKMNYPRVVKGQWWDIHNIRWVNPKELENYLMEPVISIQFMDKKSQLDEMYLATINESIVKKNSHVLYFEDAFLPGMYWLEYNDINARKETMLATLIKRKGYEPSDVVVFGDNINDLGMFQLGGTVVVVNNASNEIKKYADYIVPSNKEGGVLKFIEQHLKELT